MVENAMCNEIIEMSAAVANQRLVFWYYPHVVYDDQDHLTLSKAFLEHSNLFVVWKGNPYQQKKTSLPIPPVPPV
jgi:hypothetical protein